MKKDKEKQDANPVKKLRENYEKRRNETLKKARENANQITKASTKS